MSSQLERRLAPAALALALLTSAAAQEAGPKVWFPEPQLDLGTHLEGEVAKGRWQFRNPHDVPHQFRAFQPSCTCSKAIVHIGDVRYTIENAPKPNTIYRNVDAQDDGAAIHEMVEAVTIAPGEEGYIDFEVDLRGVHGPKEASVVIQTDDESNRVITLSARAVATQFFVVVPAEINLNKMNWKDERQFTARITSPIQPDFEIVGIDGELPDKMKIDYRKELNDGVATWVVDGTYGPNVDPRAGGGIVNFRTNVDNRRVALRVMAWVEGPLTLEPGAFMSFGRIKAAEGASRSVEFRSNDAGFELKIEKVELENLTVDPQYVSYQVTNDGTVSRFELTIAPDAPRRLVRGDIKVHLNHPAAPVQELQFSGFVR